MTTKKQEKASRRNGRKSNGPTSAGGKEIVAGNAERHGLAARRRVLRGESEEEYAELLYALVSELGVEGTVETFLAQRMGECMWRLRRCMEIETGLIERNRTGITGKDEGPAGAFDRDTRWGPNGINKLMRYESALERNFHRALRTLTVLQAVGSGKAVFAPGEVGFEAPPWRTVPASG